MRKYILAAGLCAAAITTTGANAAQVCQQDGTGRAVATVAGAGIGAILGRVITGAHGGTAGALIGGVAGGVAGNQLAKNPSKCEVSYGYYDDQNRWHANRIAASDARGYYDRDGRWNDGPPNGYYDRDNRWVAFNGDPQSSGYTDREGRWIPVGASGYYAADGKWVSASAPGYYDRNGRWVAGPVSGRYNANGVWTADNSGYGAPSGSWAYQTQPGYYDGNGRWVRGETTGYYDGRGRWVSSSPVSASNGNGNGNGVRRWSVADRADRIQNRVASNRDRGVISRQEADSAYAELASIRRDDTRLRRRNGVLAPGDRQMLQDRLDRVAQQARADREDGNNYPG